MSFMQAVKGKREYQPLNEEKYFGKRLPQIRSSWEEKFMKWLDTNENVLRWSSEPLGIRYNDPMKRKTRTYYPDFLMTLIDKNNQQQIYLVEIKPFKETKPPNKTRNKKNKTFFKEMATWKTNLAKWNAAKNYSIKKGWDFVILTEKELF